jgi:hypothetical protein
MSNVNSVEIQFNVIPSPILRTYMCSLHLGFPTKIMYAFLFSPIHATCPNNLTLLHVTILIISGEKYML